MVMGCATCNVYMHIFTKDDSKGNIGFVFILNSCKFVLYNEKQLNCEQKVHTTFNNGSLGSRIDEERSEMR